MADEIVYKKATRKTDKGLEGKVVAKHGKQTNQKLKPYVVYKRSKHDVEFGLQASEDMLLMHFSSLASTMYMVDLKNPQNNHAAIARFADAIANCEMQYDRMVQCSNDYSPFIKTKKPKS